MQRATVRAAIWHPSWIIGHPGRSSHHPQRMIPRLELFRPTVGSAVDAYVAETGVEWREEDVEPNTNPGGPLTSACRRVRARLV